MLLRAKKKNRETCRIINLYLLPRCEFQSNWNIETFVPYTKNCTIPRKTNDIFASFRTYKKKKNHPVRYLLSSAFFFTNFTLLPRLHFYCSTYCKFISITLNVIHLPEGIPIIRTSTYALRWSYTQRKSKRNTESYTRRFIPIDNDQ